MIFHTTILALGEHDELHEEDTDDLSPVTVEIFRLAIGKNGVIGDWDILTPFQGTDSIELRYSGINASGALVSFFSGSTPLTLSALLRGSDSEKERQLVNLYQRTISGLVRSMSLGGLEAGGDILSISQRPLMASFPVPSPSTQLQDLALVRRLEKSFMTAWVLLKPS